MTPIDDLDFQPTTELENAPHLVGALEAPLPPGRTVIVAFDTELMMAGLVISRRTPTGWEIELDSAYPKDWPHISRHLGNTWPQWLDNYTTHHQRN